MLERISYRQRNLDWASHVQNLPEVTLKPKTTSFMTSTFTSHFSMPSMSLPAISIPEISMPKVRMPTISVPSVSLPKLSFPPSFSELTLPSFNDLASSPFMSLFFILLIISLFTYILHTYLINPRKDPGHIRLDIGDARGHNDSRNGPRSLNTLDLQERCRAQARRDYALNRLTNQPSQLQQWRVGVPPPPPYQRLEAQRIDVPARAPAPPAPPVMTQSPAPVTPVPENHEVVVRVPSGGFLARIVEVVSLRRSTRVRRAPERFDEMVFPPGRRT